MESAHLGQRQVENDLHGGLWKRSVRGPNLLHGSAPGLLRGPSGWNHNPVGALILLGVGLWRYGDAEEDRVPKSTIKDYRIYKTRG